MNEKYKIVYVYTVYFVYMDKIGKIYNNYKRKLEYPGVMCSMGCSIVFGNYRLETYSLSGDDNQTVFQSYLVYSMMVSVDIQPLSDDPDTVQGCAILLSNTDDITGISPFILPRSVACSVYLM